MLANHLIAAVAQPTAQTTRNLFVFYLRARSFVMKYFETLLNYILAHGLRTIYGFRQLGCPSGKSAQKFKLFLVADTAVTNGVLRNSLLRWAKRLNSCISFSQNDAAEGLFKPF